MVKARIDAILALMTPDELAATPRYLTAFEQFGSMGAREVELWRERIAAVSAAVSEAERRVAG